MSLLHLCFAGHFSEDNGVIRFFNTPDDSLLKPVVVKALDSTAIANAASTVCENNSLDLPSSWHIWSVNGYLSFDRYGLPQDAVWFLELLLAATDCQLVDFNSRRIFSATELKSK